MEMGVSAAEAPSAAAVGLEMPCYLEATRIVRTGELATCAPGLDAVALQI